MFINNLFRSRLLVMGVLLAFVLLVSPVVEFAQVKAPAAGASLVGFIYGKDMSTPIANAVVKVRNLSEPKEYASLPTDANGMYKISGIEEGRYILGVTSGAGNFNFDYALVLKGNEMAKLSVALKEGGQTTGKDAEAKSFWTTGTIVGVAIFVAGVAFMTYEIVKKPKEETSPIR